MKPVARQPTMEHRQYNNLTTVTPCLVAIGIMCVLVAYSPTLYRMFCAATGLAEPRNGSPPIPPSFQTDDEGGIRHQRRARPAVALFARQRAVTVHLGEQKLVYFTAEISATNRSSAMPPSMLRHCAAASTSTKSNASASPRNGSTRTRRSTCQWCSMSIRRSATTPT